MLSQEASCTAWGQRGEKSTHRDKPEAQQKTKKCFLSPVFRIGPTVLSFKRLISITSK